MTTPVGTGALVGLLGTYGRAPVVAREVQESTAGLWRLGELSFDAAVQEALRMGQKTPMEVPDGAEEPMASSTTAPHTSDGVHTLQGGEADIIAREASRTRVDPALLVALRRAENGAPGREFGVLSVTADGLDAQARVAANTVRNTVTRFEQTGGVALDPSTGRYTEDFLRFLSSRYAPIGAANDPGGLNRHHAANLIALYRKASAGHG
jgi:hypothetical protein